MSSKNRRSSILKPTKVRNPLSDLSSKEDNYKQNNVRSKRVSFATNNSVKPFTVDSEKVTIWDSTYEESIETLQSSDNNVQNDTKSSHQSTISDDKCQSTRTFGTKIYGTSNNPQVSAIQVDFASAHQTIRFDDVYSLPVNPMANRNSYVNNVLEISPSLSESSIFPKRSNNLQVQQKSFSDTNILTNILNQRPSVLGKRSASVTFCEVGDENKPPKINPDLASKIESLLNGNKPTNNIVFNNTPNCMQLTEVESEIILMANHTSSTSEDMEITDSNIISNIQILEVGKNVSTTKYDSIKNTDLVEDKTINFKEQAEIDGMELTTCVPTKYAKYPEDKNINFKEQTGIDGMELTTCLPTRNTNRTEDKTINFKEQTGVDGMELTTCVPTKSIKYTEDKTINFKEQTGIDGMELTTCLPTRNTNRTEDKTINFKEQTGVDGMEFTTCVSTKSIKYTEDKTINFKKQTGIDGMELTTCLPSRNTNRTEDKTINFKEQTGVDGMEFTTCVSTKSIKYTEDKTINFKELAGIDGMELTTCLPTRNTNRTEDKTINFKEQTGVDGMEFTTCVSTKSIKYTEDKTINFKEQTGIDGMELTTCLPARNTNRTEDKMINFKEQTSVDGMELTTCLPIRNTNRTEDKTINFKEQTGVDAMEFTTCVPTKSIKYTEDKTINFKEQTAGTDGMELTTCLPTRNTNRTEDKTINFKEQTGVDGMEFTTCVSTKSIKYTEDKTINFKELAGIDGTEITTSLPTRNTNRTEDKAINFKEQAGVDGMEFTTCVPTKSIKYTEDKSINFKEQAGIDGMELTTCFPTSNTNHVEDKTINLKEQTGVDGMELTTCVPTKNIKYLEDKTINFKEQTGIDGMELTTCLPTINTNRTEDKTINFKEQTCVDGMEFTTCVPTKSIKYTEDKIINFKEQAGIDGMELTTCLPTINTNHAKDITINFKEQVGIVGMDFTTFSMKTTNHAEDKTISFNGQVSVDVMESSTCIHTKNTKPAEDKTKNFREQQTDFCGMNLTSCAPAKNTNRAEDKTVNFMEKQIGMGDVDLTSCAPTKNTNPAEVKTTSYKEQQTSIDGTNLISCLALKNTNRPEDNIINFKEHTDIEGVKFNTSVSTKNTNFTDDKIINLKKQTNIDGMEFTTYVPTKNTSCVEDKTIKIDRQAGIDDMELSALVSTKCANYAEDKTISIREHVNIADRECLTCVSTKSINSESHTRKTTNFNEETAINDMEFINCVPITDDAINCKRQTSIRELNVSSLEDEKTKSLEMNKKIPVVERNLSSEIEIAPNIIVISETNKNNKKIDESNNLIIASSCNNRKTMLCNNDFSGIMGIEQSETCSKILSYLKPNNEVTETKSIYDDVSINTMNLICPTTTSVTNLSRPFAKENNVEGSIINISDTLMLSKSKHDNFSTGDLESTEALINAKTSLHDIWKNHSQNSMSSLKSSFTFNNKTQPKIDESLNILKSDSQKHAENVDSELLNASLKRKGQIVQHIENKRVCPPKTNHSDEVIEISSLEILEQTSCNLVSLDETNTSLPNLYTIINEAAENCERTYIGSKNNSFKQIEENTTILMNITDYYELNKTFEERLERKLKQLERRRSSLIHTCNEQSEPIVPQTQNSMFKKPEKKTSNIENVICEVAKRIDILWEPKFFSENGQNIWTFGFLSNSLILLLYLDKSDSDDEHLAITNMDFIFNLPDNVKIPKQYIYFLLKQRALVYRNIFKLCYKSTKDIFNLLECLSTEVKSVQSILNDFISVRRYGIGYEKNFIAVIIIASLPLMLSLRIKINFLNIYEISEDDITFENINPHNSPKHIFVIKNLIKNTKKDVKFLFNFIKNVYDLIRCLESSENEILDKL